MDRGSLRIVRWIAVAALAAAAAPFAPAAETLPPWMFHYPVDGELAFTHDDNVNRGRDSELRIGDDVASLTFRQPRDQDLGRNVRLEITPIAALDVFRRHSGLDRVSGGVEALLEYRASGAFDATTWALVGRAAYDEYDSGLRDGARYFIGVSAERALTDRIQAYLEAGRNETDASSDVFNGHDYAAKLSLVYSIGDKDVAYLTGQYRKGDTVSTGGPSLVNAELARVLVPDDAFDSQLIAYRFKARTVFSLLGWNHALGPRAAIDLSWRRVDSAPDDRPGIDFPGRLRYIANQYSLVYLRRF